MIPARAAQYTAAQLGIEVSGVPQLLLDAVDGKVTINVGDPSSITTFLADNPDAQPDLLIAAAARLDAAAPATLQPMDYVYGAIGLALNAAQQPDGSFNFSSLDPAKTTVAQTFIAEAVAALPPGTRCRPTSAHSIHTSPSRRAPGCTSSVVSSSFSCLPPRRGAFAQGFQIQPIQYPSARMDALGGNHVALADDVTTLLVNPAGFQAAGPQFTFAELSANLTGPIFSIADLVVRIVNGANPVTLLVDPTVQSLLTSLYTSMTLNGPVAFGYVGNGLGFGFFNSSGLTFSTVGTVPTITAGLGEDLEFVGGYAFRIPLPAAMKSKLDVGLSVKAFARGSVELSESIVSFFSFLSSPALNILMSQPFNINVGFGVDAGIRYSWNDVISVGIVGGNLYSPVMRNGYATLTAFTQGSAPTVTYGTVPIDLSAGLVYSPRLGPLEAYMSGLKVMLDYGDILDFLTHPATATNPVLHVGLGVEAVLLQILSLRGGFGQGYFSAGLGINLTAFTFNVTMYGSELSTEPGLRPAYNLLTGLEFRY